MLIIIGLLSGVLGGMGVGGGTLLIPALTIFFQTQQQQAQKINLLYFIPTAVVALVIHIKDGNVEKKAVGWLAVCGAATAVFGALLAVRMDADVLRRVFGFFLLVMGVMEFFKREPYRNNPR